MGRDLPVGPGTDARFWDGFLEVVRAQSVRVPFDRWYVIRAEHYLKTYPETPLSRHRPEEVSVYLTEIGRKGSLKDWQFRQVVGALEVFFCKAVVAPWAGQFDWGYWKDSSRSLKPHHATIARDVLYRKRAAATIVRRPLKVWARCGETTERCSTRSSPRSGVAPTPSEPSRRTSTGLAVSSPFAVTGTRASWVQPRSGLFSKRPGRAR